MSSSSSTSLLNVELQPGKPPMLRAEATGDAARWAAEHRNALRALVAEHGSLLVRGLGLRDAAETEAVFRRLGSLLSWARTCPPPPPPRDESTTSAHMTPTHLSERCTCWSNR